VAVAIESLKIFSLIRGNTLWSLSKERSNEIRKRSLQSKALGAWLFYVGLAIFAVLASYGYTLTIVNRGQQAQTNSIVQIDMEKNRALYNTTTEDRLSTIKEKGDLSIKYNETASWSTKEIADLKARKDAEEAKIITMSEALKQLDTEYFELKAKSAVESQETRSTSTMFGLMATSFNNMGEQRLTLIILLTISIIIELGIIVTSPELTLAPEHLHHFIGGKPLATVLPKEPKKTSKIKVRKSLKDLFKKPPKLAPKIKPVRDKVATKKPKKVVTENPKSEVDIKPVATTKPPVRQRKSISSTETKVVPVVETPAAEVPELVISAEGKVDEDLTVYRFGKTSPAVKAKFVLFIKALFKDSHTHLRTVQEVTEELGLSVKLSHLFSNRIFELTSPEGRKLIERNSEGLTIPNYPMEYIIEYTTEIIRSK
jgi:hypothetical protein